MLTVVRVAVEVVEGIEDTVLCTVRRFDGLEKAQSFLIAQLREQLGRNLSVTGKVIAIDNGRRTTVARQTLFA